MNITINKDVKNYYTFALQYSLFFILISIVQFITHWYRHPLTIELLTKHLIFFVILLSTFTLGTFLRSIKPWLIELFIDKEKREISLTYSKKNKINIYETIDFKDIEKITFSYKFDYVMFSKFTIFTADLILSTGKTIKIKFPNLESFLQTYMQLYENITAETKSDKKNTELNLDEIIENYKKDKTITSTYDISYRNSLIIIQLSIVIFIIFYLFFL